MNNKWIQYVKRIQHQYGCSYKEALEKASRMKRGKRKRRGGAFSDYIPNSTSIANALEKTGNYAHNIYDISKAKLTKIFDEVPNPKGVLQNAYDKIIAYIPEGLNYKDFTDFINSPTFLRNARIGVVAGLLIAASTKLLYNWYKRDTNQVIINENIPILSEKRIPNLRGTLKKRKYK